MAKIDDANFNPGTGESSYKPNTSDSNITPPRGAYASQGQFRFWCQKVLPLVYDDSLSYYELLCKVVDYLNKTMQNVAVLEQDVTDTNKAFSDLQEHMNEQVTEIDNQFANLQDYTNEQIENVRTAFNELQQYVNDYYHSLDVQEEINKKLDDMAEDGSLSKLIQPLFDTYKAQIDETVNQQNESIRLQNDAIKAQNSRIDNIVAQAGTDNTEVVDARQYNVPQTGTSPTLRGAINSQTETLYGLGKTNANLITNGKGELTFDSIIGETKVLCYFPANKEINITIENINIDASHYCVIGFFHNNKYSGEKAILQAGTNYTYTPKEDITELNFTSDTFGTNYTLTGVVLTLNNDTYNDVKQARNAIIPCAKVTTSLEEAINSQADYIYKTSEKKKIISESINFNENIPFYANENGSLLVTVYQVNVTDESTPVIATYTAGIKEVVEHPLVANNSFIFSETEESAYIRIGTPTGASGTAVISVQFIPKEIHHSLNLIDFFTPLTGDLNHQDTDLYQYTWDEPEQISIGNYLAVFSIINNGTYVSQSFLYTNVLNISSADTSNANQLIKGLTINRYNINDLNPFIYGSNFYHFNNIPAVSVMPCLLTAGTIQFDITVDTNGIIAFYGSDKKYLGQVDIPQSGTYTYVSNNTIAGVQCTVPIINLRIKSINNDYSIEKLPLSGIKYYALGDSFTHGDFTGIGQTEENYSSQYNMYKTYVYWCALRNYMIPVNLGVNGWTSKDIVDNKQYEKIAEDAQVCTLMIGLNDFSQNIPIGTENDTEENGTFYGYINTILSWMRTNRPWTHFGVIINSAYLGQSYRDALKQASINYGYPYLDLYSDPSVPAYMSKSGMNTEIQSALYKRCQVSETNGHPNVEAYKLITPAISNFINKI